MTPPEFRASDEPEGRSIQLEELIEARAAEGAASLLTELHPSDAAELIGELDDDDRVYALDLLPPPIASEILAAMDPEDHPEALLASFDPGRIGELVTELADDDAVDLIGELPPDEQSRVLSALSVVEAGELRRLLQYPEETAGGIMTTDLIAVSVHLTAGETIQEVRKQARALGEEFYSILVVDLFRRLLGTVGVQDLVLAEPDTPLSELIEPPVATVTADMDQEEVGRIIARYNLPSIGVVGPAGVLLGRITWDDVVDVLEAEQTEDILRFGGVGREEEVRGEWGTAVRSRLPWLFLNLLTAGVAASVPYFFQGTIERLVLLAAIMPVIAGMGGNAGTQALAVTVRRLALTTESSARRWRIAAKELLVGLVNGAALGGTIGLAGYVWLGEPLLGLVVLVAMWGNLIVASFAGAMVPVLLERLGVDPAVASSIFVTTFTDLAGFALLLGLASTLLL